MLGHSFTINALVSLINLYTRNGSIDVLGYRITNRPLWGTHLIVFLPKLCVLSTQHSTQNPLEVVACWPWPANEYGYGNPPGEVRKSLRSRRRSVSRRAEVCPWMWCLWFQLWLSSFACSCCCFRVVGIMWKHFENLHIELITSEVKYSSSPSSTARPTAKRSQKTHQLNKTSLLENMLIPR